MRERATRRPVEATSPETAEVMAAKAGTNGHQASGAGQDRQMRRRRAPAALRRERRGSREQSGGVPGEESRQS
jgi:hypothetical protein